MRNRLISTLALALLLISACGGDQGEGPLTVYSGRSEELVQPLIDDFMEATGIDVEVRYAGSTDLAATLLQEGDATEADVFFSQDPASLGSVAAMLQPLPEEILNRVDSRFVDGEGRWVGTSGRVRTFIYNTSETVALPESIDDVIDPRWAGQLGVAPTNGSFLAFVAAMILDRGEDATADWLEGLAALEPQDFPGNSPIVAATDSGQIQGGLVNHYYLFRLRSEGAGDDAENWFFPAGGVGNLVMPAGAGIIEGSDMTESAQRFIDFLLSTDAQQYFAAETFEYPLIEDVAQADGLPALSDIDSPAIDLSALAGLLDDATRLVTEAGF